MPWAPVCLTHPQFVGMAFANVNRCLGAMGAPNATHAVVDTKGRVLGGVQRLRIVDASVLPILPPGQPMATLCKFDFGFIVGNPDD